MTTSSTRTDLDSLLQSLLKPSSLWTRPELLVRPSPIPTRPGVYAWFFRNLDGLLPTADCHVIGDWSLLYLGIAPVDLNSKRFLRTRLANHLRGRADRSTLRFSLGSILCSELNLNPTLRGLRKVHFGEGEARLSTWMDANSAVCWYEINEPWLFEGTLIKCLRPPVNLKHNSSHPFVPELSRLRKEMLDRAREDLSISDSAEGVDNSETAIVPMKSHSHPR